MFATVGYGAAVGLYIIFGIAAGFSGWILWKVFMGLDSSRFPLVSYGGKSCFNMIFLLLSPRSLLLGSAGHVSCESSLYRWLQQQLNYFDPGAPTNSLEIVQD